MSSLSVSALAPKFLGYENNDETLLGSLFGTPYINIVLIHYRHLLSEIFAIVVVVVVVKVAVSAVIPTEAAESASEA